VQTKTIEGQRRRKTYFRHSRSLPLLFVKLLDDELRAKRSGSDARQRFSAQLSRNRGRFERAE
jgi:hypothetical protein